MVEVDTQGADANETVRALGEAVFTGDEHTVQELLFKTRDVVAVLVRERDRMRAEQKQGRSLVEAARHIPVAPTWAGIGTLMYLDASVARLVNEAVRAFDAATASPDGGQDGGG